MPRRDGTIREVLLDGAHNPAGGAALAVALDDLRPLLAGGRDTIPPPITLVWAAMRDKDVAGVLTAVARSRSLAGARVVSTTLRLPRAMPAPELADAWRASLPGSRVSVAADIDDAMDQALATTDGPIVVAGSLYLVGAVRSRLVDDPLLRDPVAA